MELTQQGPNLELDCARRAIVAFSVALTGEHVTVALTGTKPGQLILLLTAGGGPTATWDPLIEWRSGLPDARLFNTFGTTLHMFLTARRPSRRGHDEPQVSGWKVR